MVALGRINSRMKVFFYDIWVPARTFPFADDRLPRAIAATFARRNTAIPAEPPDALTPSFAADQSKQAQWYVFVQDVAIDPGPSIASSQISQPSLCHAQRPRRGSLLHLSEEHDNSPWTSCKGEV
jgi:hypothetical protein